MKAKKLLKVFCGAPNSIYNCAVVSDGGGGGGEVEGGTNAPLCACDCVFHCGRPTALCRAYRVITFGISMYTLNPAYVSIFDDDDEVCD